MSDKTYATDEKLKSYLDTDQLNRERLCLAVLSTDKRFSDVRPRHPRGGRDGGRDIEAVFRGELSVFGAVGFRNQASDTKEHKAAISKKFYEDLDSALSASSPPEVFVFFTNINFTIGEKDAFIKVAKGRGLKHVEIFDRERLRVELDSPHGFSIRFQYLNISLSEEEQASFFARWGDDIQSIVSTGFGKLEMTLDRVLFFQEAQGPLKYLTVSLELDKEYSGDDIGHFRSFCSVLLKEPKQKIWGLLFGLSDRPQRLQRDGAPVNFSHPAGIKSGICGAQWEKIIEKQDQISWDDLEGPSGYKRISTTTSIGLSQIKSLPLSYGKDTFIRLEPSLVLRDLDDASFVLFLNKSFASKVHRIEVFANGYKLHEVVRGSFHIDEDPNDVNIPLDFSSDELSDRWVIIRPNTPITAFHLSFFDVTPQRMFVPDQVADRVDVEQRKKNR